MARWTGPLVAGALVAALTGYGAIAYAPDLLMAAAIRRKHRGRLHNRGVGSVSSLRAILRFLDSVTQEAGLEPGLEGLVAEPWERLSPEDGTGPMRDFRGEETWHDRDRAERCVQSCACLAARSAAVVPFVP